MLDDVLDGCLAESHLRGERVETRILQLLRNQVALGYFYLLLGDVAAYFYQLHAVEQWARDGTDVIGGGDEENLREVVIHIQIVVVEGYVLLWVEYFEQCRCRVAMIVIA